jgi:hypothetical protein
MANDCCCVTVIGVMGVVIGASIQAKRDDRRWERERTRETERWEREDCFRWASAKRENYSNFVRTFEEWRGRRFYGRERPQGETDTSNILWKQFDRAYCELILLADTKVTSAANRVRTALLDGDLYFNVLYSAQRSDDSLDPEGLKDITRHALKSCSPDAYGRLEDDWDPVDAIREELTDAITECIMQMKKDLGASDDH